MKENPHMLELGIEFLVELLLFLYPYGADQMGLPHSFWFGLFCWVVATAIAIRMFWIFPGWTARLSSVSKAVVSAVLVVIFVGVFYRPVMGAYRKQSGEAQTRPAPPEPEPIDSDPKVKPLPAAKPQKPAGNGVVSDPGQSKMKSGPASKEQEAVAKERGVGSIVIQNSPGSALSVGQQGGITAGTVNIGTIPKPDRRIPDENRVELIAFLKKAPAKVSIVSVMNDKESYRFAKDWYEILEAAGWEIEGNNIGHMSAGEPWVGFRLNIRGDTVKPGEKVTVMSDSAPGSIARVATALKVENLTVQPVPQQDEKLVEIMVGLKP